MENQNEPQGKLGRLFQKKAVRYGLGALVVAALCGGGYFVGKPLVQEVKTSSAVKSIQEKGFGKAYIEAFFSVVHKLGDLEKLDRTNEALVQQVAQLERELEEEKAKNVQSEAKEVTENLEERLRGEAGSELARVLQSIEYKAPTHLLPHQQYALALGYFRKQEYEQAAVLFSYLTELKEDTSYQRAEVYLMSGISWFKLKHYKLSNEYVKKTLKKSDDDTAIHRKAILWQAMLANAQGNKAESQKILTSLVAQYPHSEEVNMINQRSPASKEKENREPHFATRKTAEAEDSHHEVKHEETPKPSVEPKHEEHHE